MHGYVDRLYGVCPRVPGEAEDDGEGAEAEQVGQRQEQDLHKH